jgi:polar amino acid transport system ATP-binding protein
MDEGVIYEEGPPEQVFGNPQGEKTRAFIQRIRGFRRTIASPGYDVYGLNAEIEAFCEKQFFSRKACHDLLLLAEEVLQLQKTRLAEAPVELAIEYSERTGVLQLQFVTAEAHGNPLDIDVGDGGLAATLVRGMAEAAAFSVKDGRAILSLTVRRG